MQLLEQRSSAKKNARALRAMGYIALLAAGFAVMALRGRYIFTSPQLYGEDGPWSAMVRYEGLWYAILHARADYHVAGNLVLVQMALWINALLFGQSLLYYPQVVACVQFGFYALAALAPVVCLRRHLSRGFRLALALLVILCPLGNHPQFILGRLCNTGFLFCFLSTCLLVPVVFDDFGARKAVLVAHLTGLFLCCATNPVCFPLVALGFVFAVIRFFNEREKRGMRGIVRDFLRPFSHKAWIVLGVLLVVYAAVFVRPGAAIETAVPANPAGQIEVVTRLLLYYFIAPFYHAMNNGIALVLFSLLALFFAATFFHLKGTQRMLLGFLLSGALLCAGCMLTTRYGILTGTTYYWQYQELEQYYYASYLTALLPTLYAAAHWVAALRQKPRAQVCLMGVASLVLCLWLFVSAGLVLSLQNRPVMGMREETFAESLRQAQQSGNTVVGEDGKIYYLVPTAPEGWVMLVSEEDLKASLQP